MLSTGQMSKRKQTVIKHTKAIHSETKKAAALQMHLLKADINQSAE